MENYSLLCLLLFRKSNGFFCMCQFLLFLFVVVDWSLPEICGWSLAGNCFILIYCLLNRGNNPWARKAVFFNVIQWSSEKSSGDFGIAERYLQPFRRQRNVPLHTPTYPTDLHMHTGTTPTCSVQSSPQCLQSRSLCCLFAPGRVSCSLHVHFCLMRGSVLIHSGNNTQPLAQPLVAVGFATALLVKSKVAAHVRCPLLVKWQWSNDYLYVPLPLHPESLIPWGRTWGLSGWKYTSCTCLGLLQSSGSSSGLHWLGSAPKGPVAEQPPHHYLGLFNPIGPLHCRPPGKLYVRHHEG